jgi:hypothetical protein
MCCNFLVVCHLDALAVKLVRALVNVSRLKPKLTKKLYGLGEGKECLDVGYCPICPEFLGDLFRGLLRITVSTSSQ